MSTTTSNVSVTTSLLDRTALFLVNQAALVVGSNTVVLGRPDQPGVAVGVQGPVAKCHAVITRKSSGYSIRPLKDRSGQVSWVAILRNSKVLECDPKGQALETGDQILTGANPGKSSTAEEMIANTHVCHWKFSLPSRNSRTAVLQCSHRLPCMLENGSTTEVNKVVLLADKLLIGTETDAHLVEPSLPCTKIGFEFRDDRLCASANTEGRVQKLDGAEEVGIEAAMVVEDFGPIELPSTWIADNPAVAPDASMSTQQTFEIRLAEVHNETLDRLIRDKAAELTNYASAKLPGSKKKNQERAQEIVNEIYMQLNGRMPEIDKSLEACIKDRIRRSAKHPHGRKRPWEENMPADKDGHVIEIAIDSKTPSIAALERDRRQRSREALEKIVGNMLERLETKRNRHREILERYFRAETHQEISIATGLKEATINVTIKRKFDQIREMLKACDEGRSVFATFHQEQPTISEPNTNRKIQGSVLLDYIADALSKGSDLLCPSINALQQHHDEKLPFVAYHVQHCPKCNEALDS